MWQMQLGRSWKRRRLIVPDRCKIRSYWAPGELRTFSYERGGKSGLCIPAQADIKIIGPQVEESFQTSIWRMRSRHTMFDQSAINIGKITNIFVSRSTAWTSMQGFTGGSLSCWSVFPTSPQPSACNLKLTTLACQLPWYFSWSRYRTGFFPRASKQFMILHVQNISLIFSHFLESRHLFNRTIPDIHDVVFLRYEVNGLERLDIYPSRPIASPNSWSFCVWFDVPYSLNQQPLTIPLQMMPKRNTIDCAISLTKKLPSVRNVSISRVKLTHPATAPELTI